MRFIKKKTFVKFKKQMLYMSTSLDFYENGFYNNIIKL